MYNLGKLITLVLSTLIITFTIGVQAHAAIPNLTIRIDQPKSPTNQSSFNLSFTALDIEGRPITIKCLKQAPGEGVYTQFGSDINLGGGGNSGSCNPNGIFGVNGTYNFRVEALAGTDNGSDTTSVVFDTIGPGDPRDYQKNKTSSCEYTIHFKTAADAGATTKVEIYRSDNTSFTADSGTRVGTVNLGSDTVSDFSNIIPDCNKTYYYVIRAFDSGGNGSNLVGDSVVINQTVVVTGTPAQAAIPLSASTTLGSILGSESEVTEKALGDIKGETTPSAEEVMIETPGTIMQALNRLLSSRLFWLLITILGIGAIWYLRHKKHEAL